MKTAIERGIHRSAIQRDVKIADDAGIRVTPGFVINGEFLRGSQNLATFRA